MSWTDNNNYNQILINTGSDTPISSLPSQNKNIIQELNSKLLNTNSSQYFGPQITSGSGFNQIPVNYSAPSTVSSVSSESTGEFNRTTTPNLNKSTNMGTQIDNYFANENSRVSSNFWNLNEFNNGGNKTSLEEHQKTNILQSEVPFKNTAEEETFLRNQANQSLNNDLWNTNYQVQTSNNNSSSDINHSNSDQSLFDLMKYGYSGFNANSNNQNYIPNNGMNNTQFSNNNSNQVHGLSYTASTTPLPSTPLSNTSPEQMTNNLSSQFQIQQDILQQQAPSQPQQISSNNNTQNLLQNYQQQQLYLEQLQQQHNQLIQNPLFIQQQAQLVSQQLQQLQLQLQIQKQQIESNNLHLLNLQQKDQLSLDKLPLTEENLIKLQQSPKAPTSDTKANSTTNSSGLGENKSSVNTELYKTELCSTFTKTGSCPYGNKCQFAHGENELKLVNRGSKYRSKPCANWSKTGSCRYGNRCCFRHGN